MKYIMIILITSFIMATLANDKITKLNKEIIELNDRIENLRSIQRWQESIMRDCGFYGKEP